MGRKLLVAVASLALTCGLFEVAFRWLDVRGFHASRTRDWAHALRAEGERLPGVYPMLRPKSEFRLDYDSDPRGYFDEAGGVVHRMNRYGFRGPDRPMQKPPGTFRIAVLGDSFTFGEGVRYEDTFVARLEAQLARDVSPRIEVWSFAVGGWATRSEINYLRREGLRFSPDLVLVVFTPNDVDNSGRLDLWTDFRKTYEPPAWLRRSYLASAVYVNAMRILVGRRYIESLVAASLEESDDWRLLLVLLSQGQRLAHRAGAGYALVVFPFMFELDDANPLAPLHQRLAREARAAGIPVLDLLPAFLGRDYTDLWVHPSDQHPNEVAHAIAADAIERFLVEGDLLRGARREPR